MNLNQTKVALNNISGCEGTTRQEGATRYEDPTRCESATRREDTTGCEDPINLISQENKRERTQAFIENNSPQEDLSEVIDESFTGLEDSLKSENSSPPCPPLPMCSFIPLEGVLPNEDKSEEKLSGIIKPIDLQRYPTIDRFYNEIDSPEAREWFKTYTKVLELAILIRQKGGRALLVGGSVRDYLTNLFIDKDKSFVGKSADFDLESYYLSENKLDEVLKYVERKSSVGKAFGIIKIILETGIDIDLSLPRTDSKTGNGHKEFEIKPDPDMSIKDASRRRDFTMNSVSADPLTGEIFDPFNGVEDIRNRILKVTDEDRFKDDPLRVLRAMQFIARFNLEPEEETLKILQEMTKELIHISKERIGAEWKKLLLKSKNPSIGLSAGMKFGVINELHPELQAISETEQEAEWHPEGNVWNHTLMTLDQASKIVERENLDENQAMTILLASLCHDLGKALVTEIRDGRIISHGHEKAGEEPSKNFLEQIFIDSQTREKVINLVKYHLNPSLLYIEEKVKGKKLKDAVIRRLAQRLYPATIYELSLVSEADHLGRGPFTEEHKRNAIIPPGKFPVGEWLLEKARALEVENNRPSNLTNGKDWISLGYKQGPEIGKLISLSNTLRDNGYTKEMVLEIVKELRDYGKAIETLEKEIQKELVEI